MIKKSLSLLCGALVFLLASCNNKSSDKAGNIPKGDILKANLDTTVNPANDFFDYANGGWIKKQSDPR
jgi:putative endopeptidase